MQLSRAERQQVHELRARDSAVRAHEQAHLAAAGRFATGGPSFEYRRGPDGRHYATGGEVKIDTSPVFGDPQATLQKAQKIRQAALAPAAPSAQDKAVAARASRMAAEAQAELLQERVEMRSQGSARSTDEYDGESGTLAKPDSEETLSTCSACGGRHSSDAHSALQAYTRHQTPELPSDIGNLITRNA